jgi:hypothetical protein
MNRSILQTGAGIMRWQLALMHTWIAWTSFHRPHLFTLVHAYGKFGTVMNEVSWGWVAAVIALGLIIMPRGSVALVLWQFASASMFALFAILVTGQVGENYGTGVYGLLCISSGVLAYLTIGQLLDARSWGHRLGEWSRRKHG